MYIRGEVRQKLTVIKKELGPALQATQRVKLHAAIPTPRRAVGVCKPVRHGAKDVQRDERPVGDGSHRRLGRRCEQRFPRDACTVHILQLAMETKTDCTP
jgi:hypothetical protein